MPKQLIATAPRKADLIEYEEGQIQPDEVKIKTTHASPKHGSELAAFRGESPHIAEYYDEDWHMFLPRASHDQTTNTFSVWNLGNLCAGIITEVGAAVTDYAFGEHVCFYGGIRESHLVKAVDNYYLKKMPASMNWQSAVCFDPAQFALGAIRDGHVRMGDRIVVFGLGAIGQMAAQMAKLAGASFVAVVDPIEKRRMVALQTGADAAFNPTNQDVGLELKKATSKLGVDIIIETSASEFALQAALRGLAYGGTIVFTGWARPFKGGLDLGKEAHFNNAKIVFSRACSEPNPDHPRWSWRRIEETCWDMLVQGRIDCESIIDPVIHFEDSAEGYEQFVDQHPEKSIKLGVQFS